jgi:hypothetical protein
MIDFNLQRALDGAPLICRDGSLVLDWMRPLERNNSTFPIAAQIKKQSNDEIVTLQYDLRGRLYSWNTFHSYDLMLDINEQQVNVHFYKDNTTGDIVTGTGLICNYKRYHYLTTKTITIEI